MTVTLPTLGLYAVASMDISTFWPRTGLGWRVTGGLEDFWLLRHTQMKKKSNAMAKGITTLGTRMYKISMPDSLWSKQMGHRERGIMSFHTSHMCHKGNIANYDLKLVSHHRGVCRRAPF